MTPKARKRERDRGPRRKKGDLDKEIMKRRCYERGKGKMGVEALTGEGNTKSNPEGEAERKTNSPQMFEKTIEK